MARISFPDEDGILRWFDPSAAQIAVTEGETWDGNNWRGHISGLQTSRATLYLTKGGRWVENRDARNEFNGSNTYRFLTDAEAQTWLIRAADAQRPDDDAEKALNKYFGEPEEESGPNPGGRPTVGPTVNVAYPRELLDRIETAAKTAGVSRAEWLRQAAEKALAAAE